MNSRVLKFDKESFKFEWKFKEIILPIKQIKYVECTINMDGHSATGYAESFFKSGAINKSFSEAWERFWMKYGMELLPKKFTYSSDNSNGYAAHPNLEKSMERSRNELIERAEILQSWQIPDIWKRDPQIEKLLNIIIKKILSPSWKIEIYKVSSSNAYETMIGLLIHPAEGIIFDATTYEFAQSHTSKFNKYKHSLKLFRSLTKMIPFKFSCIENLEQLPKEASPIDHARFYRSIANIKAFDTHRFSNGTAIGLLSDFENIKTIVLINAPEFPVLSFSYHEKWPKLSWGQNSLVPQYNNLPHPIA